MMSAGCQAEVSRAGIGAGRNAGVTSGLAEIGGILSIALHDAGSLPSWKCTYHTR